MSNRLTISSTINMSYMEDGEDVLQAVTDNQHDSFALDSTGMALAAQQRSTNVRLWLGSEQQTISSVVATLSYVVGGNVPSGVTVGYNITTDSGAAAGNVAIVNVNVKKNTMLTDDLKCTIIVTCAEDTRTVIFSLSRVMSGANGKTPVRWQLLLSQTQLAFQRTRGGFTPAQQVVGVQVQRDDGNGIVNMGLEQAYYDYHMAVCAATGEPPSSYSSSQRIDRDITVSSTDVGEGVAAIGLSLFDIATSTAFLHDKQSLTIVKDGADGNEGAPGKSFRRIYKSTNSSTAPSTPTGSSPSGWSATPTTVSSSARYRYMSEGSSSDGGTTWVNWSSPVLDMYLPEDGTSISIKGRAIAVFKSQDDSDYDMDGCPASDLVVDGYATQEQIDQIQDGDVFLYNYQHDLADHAVYSASDELFHDNGYAAEGDCYIDMTGVLWEKVRSSSIYWRNLGQIKGEKGDKGDDGDNAVQYQLQTDPSVVNYATDENGIYIGDDVTVTGTAVKTDGDSAPVIGDSGAFQVFVRPEYTNMSTGVKSYLSWSGAANTKSYLLKKSLATHKTLRITAVQFKIASSTNADAIVSAVVPVVLGGIQGVQGLRGKTGRFYYYAGTFDSSNDTDEFVVSDAEAPYFETGKLSYHIFNYDVNGRYTMSDMWDLTESSGSPAQKSFNNAPWEPMTSDFKYLITEAIFGAYAHFGSAIINKDWLLSGNGTIDGTLYKSGETYGGEVAYTRFDPLFPYGAGNATISVKTSVVSWNTSSGVRPLTDAMSLKAGKVYAIKVLCHVERTYAAIQADTFPQIRFWFDDGESGVSELIGTTDQSQYDKEQLLQKTISVDSDGEYTVDAELTTPTNYGSGYVTMIVLECKTNDMFVPMYCVDLLSGETSMAGGRVRADARGDLSIKGALMYSSIRQDIFTSTDGSEYFLHQGIYTGNKLAPRIRSNYFCINGSLSYTTDSVYNVYMPPARLFEGMEITIINNARVRTDSSLQVPLTLSVPTDFDDIDPVKDDASPTVATIWNRFAILFPSDKVAYEGGGGLYGYSIKTTGASVIKLVATMHPEIEFTHPSGSSPSQAEYNKSCIAWCVVDVK